MRDHIGLKRDMLVTISTPACIQYVYNMSWTQTERLMTIKLLVFKLQLTLDQVLIFLIVHVSPTPHHPITVP